MFKSPFFFILAIFVVAATARHSVHAEWVKANGLYTGRIWSLAADGTNLFAGGDAGVFRSNDNGTTWLSAGLENAGSIVALLAVDGVLLAGTGSGNYRSTNNGGSWTDILSGQVTSSFAKFGNNLFAGTSGGFFQCVYRSTDNGATWQNASTGLGDPAVYSLAASGTHIFAGTYGAGSGVGVWVSTDSGSSWSATAAPATGVIALAVTGSNVFAASGGVIRSTDNGMNWTESLPNLGIRALAIHGTNIFAAGSGVHVSTDNGTTWTNVSNGLLYPVATLATGGTTLFAGHDRGGVYRSQNNGTTWEAASPGLISTDIRAFIVGEPNLLVGTWGARVFRTTDNGTNWQGASIGLTDTEIISFTTHASRVFAGGYSLPGDGVSVSTNNGLNWQAANTGLPPNTYVSSFASMGTNLFAGTISGVYLSTNDGASWDEVNSGLTFPIVSSLAVMGSNLFAGTGPPFTQGGGGVFLSTNNGASWQEVNNGLSALSVSCLAVNGNYLYAGTNGGGIFRSSDNGASWQQINTGLVSHIVRSLVTIGANLFAGVQGGMYVSIDNDTIWTEVGEGLPIGADIQSLGTNSDYLFAGIAAPLFESGVWRRPLSEMALSQTMLVRPENGSGQPLNLTLEWRNVPGAELYTAQVALDPTFTNIVVNDTSLTDTSRAIGPLADNTVYYWRVRARSSTLGGPFSSVWSFTTVGAPPSQVALISPLHGATIDADTVECYWFTSGPSVTRYWFERALDSLFTSPLVDSTLTATETITRGLLTNTTYWWRVRAKNIAGWGPYSDPRSFTVIITDVAEAEGLPTEFSLKQNYPNPFNPSTIIAYDLPSATHVTLAVYDVLGREVRTLINESQVAGRYNVEFAATGLASGVYLYRITAGEYVQTRKLLLLR
jgi:hypothetical protein